MTDEQRRAMEETMRLVREDAARMAEQKPRPGDLCPGCGGAGHWFWDDGLGGQVLGCEDCAGTGRVLPQARGSRGERGEAGMKQPDPDDWQATVGTFTDDPRFDAMCDARQRARKAEAANDCPSCQQLQRDLAAARGERDRLRVLIDAFVASSQIRYPLGNGQIVAHVSELEWLGLQDAARAALEKANG